MAIKVEKNSFFEQQLGNWEGYLALYVTEEWKNQNKAKTGTFLLGSVTKWSCLV